MQSLTIELSSKLEYSIQTPFCELVVILHVAQLTQSKYVLQPDPPTSICGWQVPSMLLHLKPTSHCSWLVHSLS